MLDIRLQTCLDLVKGGGTVCDVGTDHALLAAELIRSGKCEHVIASDIKEGPLDSARRTVEKYELGDKVDLVLSDGLTDVPLDGVSDVVIAGLGGETIAEIIGTAISDGEVPIGMGWVLQPMTKAEHLRSALYDMGWEITEERAVEGGDKMYVIMRAELSTESRCLTEFESVYGFFDEDDEMGRKYRLHEAEQMKKVSESLDEAGRQNEAAHLRALAYKLENGTDFVPVSKIYECFAEVFPFNTQDKWDNSGLLVNAGQDCSRVLVSLDIDWRAVDEAELKSSDIVISHHPVIFDPPKKISREMPVYRLIQNDISALCMHTNVDKSPQGTNGVILRELTKRFALEGEPAFFNSDKFGYVCTFKDRIAVSDFVAALKDIFGCEYIRVSAGARKVQKVAFCSGSGSSFLDEAEAAGCDAYITGDVKHDMWMTAENSGIKIFDCGHFHTENLVIWEFRRILEEKFPQLDVEIAESSVDPCVYL